MDYSNTDRFPARIEVLEDRIISCRNILLHDHIELAVKCRYLAVCDDSGMDLITIEPPELQHEYLRIARIDMSDDVLAPTRRLQDTLREELKRIIYDSEREVEILRAELAEVTP